MTTFFCFFKFDILGPFKYCCFEMRANPALVRCFLFAVLSRVVATNLPADKHCWNDKECDSVHLGGQLRQANGNDVNGESSPANPFERLIKPFNMRLRVVDKNWNDQLFRDEHGDCL